MRSYKRLLGREWNFFERQRDHSEGAAGLLMRESRGVRPTPTHQTLCDLISLLYSGKAVVPNLAWAGEVRQV